MYFTPYKMTTFAQKLQFVNFCKTNFPLTYNSEILTEASEGESDSHLIEFLKKIK